MTAFTDRFGHWLNEIVQVAPRAAVDADRVETFGADVPMAAYIERKPRMIRDAGGREVIASATVFVDISPTVEPTARLTMPDGKRPKILNVGRFTELIEHQELFVG